MRPGPSAAKTHEVRHIYPLLGATKRKKAMLPSFFLQLPENLTCSVLSEWLDTRYLGRVDNAMCSHSQRRVWLNLLSSSKGICAKIKMSSVPMSFLAWIVRRRLIVTNFCLFKLNVPKADLDQYLSVNDRYIQDLYVNSCMAADHDVLSGCALLHHLKSFTYTMCCDVDKDRLLSLLQNNPNLAAVKMFIPPRLAFGDIYEDLYLPKLTTLACRIHKGVIPLFQPSLLRLDVDDDKCCKVPDTVVQEIALRCPEIRTLRCEAMHLGTFLEHCPHIVNLCVTNCSCFTDAIVLQVVKKLPKLRTLDLSDGSTKLTNLSMEYIASFCGSTLETLHVFLPVTSFLLSASQYRQFTKMRRRFSKLQDVVISSVHNGFTWSMVERKHVVTVVVPCSADASFFDMLLLLDRIDVLVLPKYWGSHGQRYEDAISFMFSEMCKLLDTYSMLCTINGDVACVEFLRVLFRDYKNVRVTNKRTTYTIDVMSLNV